jgi:hypothetical protein
MVRCAGRIIEVGRWRSMLIKVTATKFDKAG